MAVQGHWCKMGYIEWREKAKLGSKLYAAQAKVRKRGEGRTELHERKKKNMHIFGKLKVRVKPLVSLQLYHVWNNNMRQAKCAWGASVKMSDCIIVNNQHAGSGWRRNHDADAISRLNRLTFSPRHPSEKRRGRFFIPLLILAQWSWKMSCRCKVLDPQQVSASALMGHYFHTHTSCLSIHRSVHPLIHHSPIYSFFLHCQNFIYKYSRTH